MPTILLQDLNAVICNASRHGLPYDIAHVTILMQMDDVNPVERDNNTYIFSYKYRLYPVEPNNFYFIVLLPFDGLTLATNGGRI